MQRSAGLQHLWYNAGPCCAAPCRSATNVACKAQATCRYRMLSASCSAAMLTLPQITLYSEFLFKVLAL